MTRDDYFVISSLPIKDETVVAPAVLLLGEPDFKIVEGLFLG